MGLRGYCKRGAGRVQSATNRGQVAAATWPLFVIDLAYPEVEGDEDYLVHEGAHSGDDGLGGSDVVGSLDVLHGEHSGDADARQPADVGYQVGHAHADE